MILAELNPVNKQIVQTHFQPLRTRCFLRNFSFGTFLFASVWTRNLLIVTIQYTNSSSTNKKSYTQKHPSNPIKDFACSKKFDENVNREVRYRYRQRFEVWSGSRVDPVILGYLLKQLLLELHYFFLLKITFNMFITLAITIQINLYNDKLRWCNQKLNTNF